jgi:hypothetical protein
MNNTEQLIADLSADLSPRKPVYSDRLALLWLLLSAVYVVAVIHWFGPIRGSALEQLVTVPRFALENLLGVAAIVAVTLSAFRAGVPGALQRPTAALATALVTLWVINYVIGLGWPAIEPSMDGKRHSCMYETLIYALPPIALAFYFSRRLYPLRPAPMALAFSLAAGLLPALYMQIACMYAPAHILKFHLAPAFMVAALGVLIALALQWARQRQA